MGWEVISADLGIFFAYTSIAVYVVVFILRNVMDALPIGMNNTGELVARIDLAVQKVTHWTTYEYIKACFYAGCFIEK